MTPVPPPFDLLWFRLIVGFIIGTCLGSFATMASYRLPRKLSIVKPDSFCPSCNTPLKAYDLVPVMSWLIMRGKCSHCGARIGARYVLIEIVAGLLTAIAFGTFGVSLTMLPAVLIITATVVFGTMALERRN